MGEVILEMKGIDKSFPGVHALDHVDLEIRKGEVLALMGEKRIVISNGGIASIIETTEEEREVLGELEKMDKYIQAMRTNLRYGKKLNIN